MVETVFTALLVLVAVLTAWISFVIVYRIFATGSETTAPTPQRSGSRHDQHI